MILVDKDIIKADEIKANIYDTVELLIDIDGITDNDVNLAENRLRKLFLPDSYNMSKTELYEDELNNYVKRNSIELSGVSKQRLYEKESVLRFTEKKGNKKISISTKFVSIVLDYKDEHSLRQNIDKISEIITILESGGYLKIVRINLNKQDSIVCGSLYRLYQCFNKNLFGDVAYQLGRKKRNSYIDSYSLINDSVFQYDRYIVIINKIVAWGLYEDRDSYKGILRINIYYDDNVSLNANSIIDILNKLNKASFEIFIEHITKVFANDLLNGFTDKVIGGFNKNE